jgi:hypothetical protein
MMSRKIFLTWKDFLGSVAVEVQGMKKVFVLLACLFLAGCMQTDLLSEVQKSVPWDSEVTYYAGKYCQENGVVYQSLQDNNKGNEPVISPSWWVK